ncbi:MAG: hypothetical protein QNK37_24445 [Acidobacteriota bacterium]|nr:hypothetical protein [Acidobacteriota bacterium]
MKDPKRLPANWISAEDEQFLKELGISGMPAGVERAVQHHQDAMDALARIEARAEGLQSLELDDKTLEELSREKGIPIEEIEEDLSFFRDLEKKPFDDCDWLS